MALQANQAIRWKERIGAIVVGRTFKHFEVLVFDFTLYPAAIAWLGTVVGGLVMTALSAFVCYLYILFYDWSKTDWLGYELIKVVRDGEEKQSRIACFVQRITQKGNWFAFLALSLYTDPFETTVYMRLGSEKYNGLSKRDLKVFWASVLVANIWWTIFMTFAVMGIRALLKLFNLN